MAGRSLLCLREEVAGHFGVTLLPPGEEREPPDWGEVFTTIICHTNMTYEEIPRRTIPQLEAILQRLGRHISLKLGIPYKEDTPQVDRSVGTTVAERMAFAAMFDGIG